MNSLLSGRPGVRRRPGKSSRWRSRLRTLCDLRKGVPAPPINRHYAKAHLTQTAITLMTRRITQSRRPRGCDAKPTGSYPSAVTAPGTSMKPMPARFDTRAAGSAAVDAV